MNSPSQIQLSGEAIDRLVREQFRLADDFPLRDDMGADDIPGWDSLAWVNLLNAIEEDQDITFDLDQVATLRTIGEIKKAAMPNMDTP